MPQLPEAEAETEGEMSKTTEKLDALLQESGAQVTVTGWKAELERCEAQLREAEEALERYAQTEFLVESGRGMVIVHGVRTVPIFESETWMLGDVARAYFAKRPRK